MMIWCKYFLHSKKSYSVCLDRFYYNVVIIPSRMFFWWSYLCIASIILAVALYHELKCSEHERMALLEFIARVDFHILDKGQVNFWGGSVPPSIFKAEQLASTSVCPAGAYDGSQRKRIVFLRAFMAAFSRFQRLGLSYGAVFYCLCHLGSVFVCWQLTFSFWAW